MLAVSGLIQHYLGVPYEKFTSKLISAIAVFNVVDYKEDAEQEFDKFCKKSKETLEFIEKNTHKEVMVSLYKLDRVINPTKGEFEPRRTRVEFKRNDHLICKQQGKQIHIILEDLEIQYYLCIAIREVNDIIARIAKYYSEEMKIPIFEESKVDIGDVK